MAKNIKGNRDGEGGRNETYIILGRGIVSRKVLVSEVKKSKHPNFVIYKRNGVEFVRSKPDSSKENNVNQKK